MRSDSGGRLPESVLVLGEALESRYEWKKASKTYEHVLASKTKTDSSNARIHEKLGACYWWASRQTQHVREFRELVKKATKAYENAAELYGKADGSGAHGKIAECYAAAKYLNSWIARSPLEKRSLLKECCSQGRKSLIEYRKARAELLHEKMCNNMLLYLLESLYATSDLEEMRKLASQGIEYADTSIEIAKKLDEKSEMLRAYALASLQSWQAQGFLLEKKDELIRRSLDFSEKALKLAQDVDDPYCVAIANWAAAMCNLLFTGKADLSLNYARKMLAEGKAVRDNYLKGVAFYILAFITNWIVLGEADPEKRRIGYEKTIEYAEDAIRHLQRVSQDFFIAETYLFYGETYSGLARDIMIKPEEKNTVLKKAILIGRRGLEHAKRSGSADAIGSVLHALSKALHFYSNLEVEKGKRRKLLEEALDHRREYVKIVEKTFPFDDWLCGVGKTYEGLIKADLAKLEKGKSRKTTILRHAVTDMEKGVSRCKKSTSSHPVPTRVAVVGRFGDWLGEALNELYCLNGESENLAKAIDVWDVAADEFKKVGLPSRAAECYWKKARSQSLAGNHTEAARSFECASTEYQSSQTKIPHLKEFYRDYSLYMQAWSEVEKARHYHTIHECSQAMNHFEKAAELHKLTRSWKHLTPNYLAWAQLEHGEALSRKEQTQRAMQVFREAARLFDEAKRTLSDVRYRLENDERNVVEELIEASNIRREYCVGRMALEEARILDQKDDHLASSERFGFSADIFKRMSKKVTVQIRKELLPIIFLCLAWQKMALGEDRASPILYEEAAELFEKAKESALDETTSLISSANSSFCKALAAGTEFETELDAKIYQVATQHLEAAANFYLKAGIESASEYIKGTQRSFDAYVYMDAAKRETDPEKRARYCTMAEKVLEMSVTSFLKARHSKKIEQISRLLSKIKEERELAISLSEILHAPSIASSPVGFVTPTSQEEKAVGLERFEHANIQANLTASVREISIGEQFGLEIQISNVGKEGVLLTKIADLVPVGFEVISKPDYCLFEDSYIDMRRKPLGPLGTEEVKMILKPLVKGSYLIKPKIVCADEKGHQVTTEIEQLAIDVAPTILQNRVPTGYGPLDSLLLGGIPENYAVILTSPSCDERDSLIRSFVETGAKKGETVFYITVQPVGLEKLAEELQSNFHLFICNPQADMIVKTLPNITKMKGVENLTEIGITLTLAFRGLDDRSKAARRACIEIVSDVLLQHRAVQTRRWLTGLIPEFKSRGFTTLAVMNRQMHPPEEVHAILGLFDGEVEICKKETGKFLRIEKMYNQKYVAGELPV